jgi:hypothetical protein
MAHYAILDDNNKVTNVIVIATESTLDENGLENEELGIEVCKQVCNDPNVKAVRTSYNGNIRVRYAGIGHSYNEEFDAFIPPQPHPSWSLNTETYGWEPPVPMPSTQPENGIYTWSEDNQNWVVQEFPSKQITAESFRSQLTLTEKLLWDSPDTASTSSQKAVIVTFKTELPLTVGDETTTELLSLLVSEGVFTKKRLDKIISE